MRVDQGAGRAPVVQLHTRSSDYSATAHLFEAPQEPGHRFFYVLQDVPTSPCSMTPEGFCLLTFEVAAQHPDQWRGVLKYLEFRFDLAPNTGHLGAVRYAIKHVWLE